MNKVIIIGNLTRDPDQRTAGETSITKFTIAVNDGYGDNLKTSFIPVTAFGKQAETCAKYLTKGSKCAVEGRIQTGSYEKDGRKVYTTDVIANKVEFIGRAKNEGANDNSGFEYIEDTMPF